MQLFENELVRAEQATRKLYRMSWEYSSREVAL